MLGRRLVYYTILLSFLSDRIAPILSPNTKYIYLFVFLRNLGLLKITSRSNCFNGENGIRKQPITFRLSMANYFLEEF